MKKIILVVAATWFLSGCVNTGLTYDASVNPRSPTSSGPGLYLSRALVGTANVYPQTRISVLNGTKRRILVDGQGFPSLGRVLQPGERAEVIFHGSVRGGEETCLFAYGLDSSGVRTGEVKDRCFRLARRGVWADNWTVRRFRRPGK